MAKKLIAISKKNFVNRAVMDVNAGMFKPLLMYAVLTKVGE
jgi:hypothetical protein